MARKTAAEEFIRLALTLDIPAIDRVVEVLHNIRDSKEAGNARKMNILFYEFIEELIRRKQEIHDEMGYHLKILNQDKGVVQVGRLIFLFFFNFSNFSTAFFFFYLNYSAEFFKI